MTKGGSRHEDGAGCAQRGGYSLSDHRDEDVNPSRYQNRFDVPEPCQGGSDRRLPGIGELFDLLHQDNGYPTSGGVAENQNTYRMEAQSDDLRTYADTLGDRPRRKSCCAPRQDPARWASSKKRTHEYSKV